MGSRGSSQLGAPLAITIYRHGRHTASGREYWICTAVRTHSRCERVKGKYLDFSMPPGLHPRAVRLIEVRYTHQSQS